MILLILDSGKYLGLDLFWFSWKEFPVTLWNIWGLLKIFGLFE